MNEPVPEPRIIVEGEESTEQVPLGSWKALYTALVVYGVVTIVVLRWLTVVMNP